MVGNKIDLKIHRNVNPKDVSNMADKHKLFQLIETSALTGKNVKEAFNIIAHKILVGI